MDRVPPTAKRSRNETFVHRRVRNDGRLFCWPDLDLGEDMVADFASFHAVDDDLGVFLHVEHCANSSLGVDGTDETPSQALVALVDEYRPLLRPKGRAWV